MARCRSYLRGLAICVTVLLLTFLINRFFIRFNVISVSGVVMIGVGFSSIDGNTPVAELFNQLSSSDGLLVLQVFGPITVALSILGITAATLDLKPLLLLFSGLIFVEFVALMVVASPLVQVQSQMDGAVDEVFLNVTPLYKTDLYIQTELNKLQSSYFCCGLRHAEDWRDQLPASCFCTPNNSSSEDSCVMLDNDFYSPTTDKLWVHSEPCGPVLKSYLSFPIKLRIGIISAVATITMAAIALCLTLGLEEYWKKPPVETTVDDFNRVKYQPKPILT